MLVELFHVYIYLVSLSVGGKTAVTSCPMCRSVVAEGLVIDLLFA